MHWKVALENMAKGRLPIGKKLRHNLSYIYVSNIMEQYYCELKLENRYLGRKITPTRMKKMGKELHDVILGIQKISFNEIVSKIESTPTYTTSFPLIAKYRNVVIAGRPDAITFFQGKPRFLTELKTTYGNSLRIWKNQIIQAGIYAFLLEELGFDCSRLQLVALRMKHDPLERIEHKNELLYPIVSVLLNRRIKDLERIYLGNIHCEHYSYSRKRIEKELDWALGYWLFERQPEKTNFQKRCQSCEFQKNCKQFACAEYKYAGCQTG